MGDMVLSVVLEELDLLPSDREDSPAQVMVTVFDDESQLASYQIGAELRREGIPAYTYPTAEKMGKQFKHADRIGARVAVVLGPDEIQQGTVAIKDLSTREQTTIPRSDLTKAIQGLLDIPPAA
jgi:histidyl-tRNA synthetase